MYTFTYVLVYVLYIIESKDVCMYPRPDTCCLYIAHCSTCGGGIHTYVHICIGYTMRMRGYRIYTTEGEARGRVDSMTPNPNCITGLYQNAEAFPFPIGSSRAVQCN